MAQSTFLKHSVTFVVGHGRSTEEPSKQCYSYTRPRQAKKEYMCLPSQGLRTLSCPRVFDTTSRTIHDYVKEPAQTYIYITYKRCVQWTGRPTRRQHSRSTHQQLGVLTRPLSILKSYTHPHLYTALYSEVVVSTGQSSPPKKKAKHHHHHHPSQESVCVCVCALSSFRDGSIVFTLQRVTVRLTFHIRLAKDFVERVRLLHSQKSNAKDEHQRKDSQDDSPRWHGKEEERNEQISHVPTPETKELFTKFRTL
jgi:hypothetical protein